MASTGPVPVVPRLGATGFAPRNHPWPPPGLSRWRAGERRALVAPSWVDLADDEDDEDEDDDDDDDEDEDEDDDDDEDEDEPRIGLTVKD
jgi:hypothetical protein